MSIINEGRLAFLFPNGWHAAKYDEWSFYRNQFQKVCGGTKAIDIVAVAPDGCFWSIEIKDYRQHARTKPSDLADEFSRKIRDSLSGIVVAGANANDQDERRIARKALRCKQMKVVLHLEQPAKHSKLFPRAIDPAKVQQQLKRLLKAVDPHPFVLAMDQMNGVAWNVTG